MKDVIAYTAKQTGDESHYVTPDQNSGLIGVFKRGTTLKAVPNSKGIDEAKELLDAKLVKLFEKEDEAIAYCESLIKKTK
jgi:hypothetical protein